MVDFILNDKEEIIYMSEQGHLKMDNRDVEVTVILTNQRFLLFQYPEDQESFRFGKVIQTPMKKDLILDRKIQEISAIEDNDPYAKYIFTDTNY